MATKLTSSLRKSITAEKESLDNKLSTEESAINKPIEPKKPAIRKYSATVKVTTPKVELVKAKEPEVIQTPISREYTKSNLVESKPLLTASSTISAKNLLANETALKVYNLANNFASSNYELGDITMQTLQAINQDFTNYLYEIVDINNISNLQALNTELITKLHLRQKNMFEESMKILMKISSVIK